MDIINFQKLTLIDFKGLLATTVFTPSCNFRCGYCHNPHLVEATCDSSVEREFFKFLETRRDVLEGVCITGGEPTLQKGLEDFIRRVKGLGFRVKLDTNGSNPSIVSDLISKSLLDYVALDIKSSKANYKDVTGSDIDVDLVLTTLEILKYSSVSFECRSTVLPKYHSGVDFTDMLKLVSGVEYYLQNYCSSNKVLDSSLRSESSFNSVSLSGMQDEANKIVKKCYVRS